MSASPMPARTPGSWEEVLGQQQQVTALLMERHRELVDVIRSLEEPAKIEPVQLTATSPVYESNADARTLSIGLINPVQATLPVALGIFGSATAADALQINPGGYLILPIRAGAVEVAAVGTIAAGVTQYAFLLRFKSVQANRYST